jgi:Gpi18-like mannosyltransferase
MGYAEATFMVFAAAVLLCLRMRRWWLAALFGFLAGLTRPVGVLLAIPAAVEGWQRRDAKAIVPALAPIAGLFVFLAWAQRRSHDLLYPLRAQQDPTRRGHWVDPIRAVAHNTRALFTGDHVSSGIHALSAVVFVLLLIVVARRWPLSFTLYAAAALVVALSSRNLDSLERYGLATVPFVLAGADVINRPGTDRVVFTLAGAGLVLASLLAFTGVLVP